MGVQLARQRPLVLVDVGQHELGSLVAEASRERAADAACTDDRHPSPAEDARTEDVLQAGVHRGLHAGCGERARVAGAALLGRLPDDVLAPPRQQGHVGGARTDILSGDVAAAEQLQTVGEIAQDLLARVPTGRLRAGREADHRLAAAERQLRGGCLERHRLRQPQRVGDSMPQGRVGPHAASAKRRPEHRGVHRDDRRHAAARATADQKRLVLAAVRQGAVRSPRHPHPLASMRPRSVAKNCEARAPSSAR